MKRKTEVKKEDSFPMRINKYLAREHVASRREADRMIEQGLVRLNGRRAVLGDKVQEKDMVEIVKGSNTSSDFDYFIAFKPAGISVEEFADTHFGNYSQNLTALDPLDKEASGAQIYSTDGLLQKKTELRRHVYSVTLETNYSPSFLKILGNSPKVGVRVIPTEDVKQLDENSFKVTATASSKDLRELCTALGFEIKKIDRLESRGVHVRGIEKGSFQKLPRSVFN